MNFGPGTRRRATEVIGRSCERLRQLAHRMLKNYPRLRRWEQTDDVLQNAMIRLHRSLAEVKPESVAQYPWVCRRPNPTHAAGPGSPPLRAGRSGGPPPYRRKGSSG